MKTEIIGALAMAVVLGFAPGAPAKSIKALIGVASQPTGTSFTTSTGNLVWSQASGFDSSGNLRCFARGTLNNTWSTSNVCDAAAVKSNAELRSTGVTFCTSTPVAWASGQVCWVNNMFLSPNGGPVVNVGTVQAWSNVSY